MLAKISSMGLIGLKGFPVTIEVDMQKANMPAFDIVGLPGASVKESRERVRAALKNSGLSLPQAQRVTVNLAPADMRKEGPIYDLPIALGMLVAQGRLEPELLEGTVVLGELSLNGDIQPVRGLLSMLISARAAGWNRFLLPEGNAGECCLEDVEVYPVKNLHQVMAFFSGEEDIKPLLVERFSFDNHEFLPEADVDMAQIRGQFAARRALEIAAAGGHNLLMIGPPGSGKTMLAKAMPGILPPMTFEESLETTQIHSVAGERGLMRLRPFRAPHHTASVISMIGGGRDALPGEIAKAHNGVLFLDELPEYPRALLEALRQPLEDGEVMVSRVGAQVTYPSQAILLASMNPCPCGYYGSSKHICRCSPHAIRQYTGKVSGPLLDRIDIHVEVGALPLDDMMAEQSLESSEAVRERVCRARERQNKRYGSGCNSQLNQRQVEVHCRLDADGKQMISQAAAHYGFSARAYTRLLKVSRTIADLAGREEIEAEHVAEAVQYRMLDAKFWGE